MLSEQPVLGRAGGRQPRAGEILCQPHLARIYKLLASEGRNAFYRGPQARSMTEYVQQCGGVLSMQDRAEHRSEWVSPLATYDIYELLPNTQCLVTLEMLNIIEGYDLQSLGRHTPQYLHILLEARKLAFADRECYVSEPTFVDVPKEHFLLGHRTIVSGPWEDDIGHAQIIAINSDTHIFEGAADLRCDGLALGW